LKIQNFPETEREDQEQGRRGEDNVENISLFRPKRMCRTRPLTWRRGANCPCHIVNIFLLPRL
jgi:hypothetical protein